ncbi:hypothetical protein [Micromonospora sp. NPDC005254]|uniref:hypothetical protein n=1 Tax=Micromonospora sp. NPDC005254 TaxID=3364229 RepID=UPI003690AFD4
MAPTDNTAPTPDDTTALIREVAAERLLIAARIIREGSNDMLAIDLISEAHSRLLDAVMPGLGTGVQH